MYLSDDPGAEVDGAEDRVVLSCVEVHILRGALLGLAGTVLRELQQRALV